VCESPARFHSTQIDEVTYETQYHFPSGPSAAKRWWAYARAWLFHVEITGLGCVCGEKFLRGLDHSLGLGPARPKNVVPESVQFFGRADFHEVTSRVTMARS